MAHNLDFSKGKPAIAFRGDRNNIWHRFGQQYKEEWTIEDWAKNAGLDFEAVKLPSLIEVDGKIIRVEGQYHIARNDTWRVLSSRTVTDTYTLHQTTEVLDWFDRYIKVDPRFQLDVAGALHHGATIWATATFNGEMSVAGDTHKAKLLMTTSFDPGTSTVNRATMTRVVCNNTLDTALADKQKSFIKTRHNTKFDADKVGKELAAITSGFAAYKAMGDAMAAKHMADDQISKFFKACFDIPFDIKSDDISTRKLNQFKELSNAYGATVREVNGQNKNTAWSALNAVTRYVDHERSTRDGDDKAESRFASAQFGSGASLKEKAVLILDEMSDGDLLRAVAAKTSDASDVSAILKQSFVPSMSR